MSPLGPQPGTRDPRLRYGTSPKVHVATGTAPQSKVVSVLVRHPIPLRPDVQKLPCFKVFVSFFQSFLSLQPSRPCLVFPSSPGLCDRTPTVPTLGTALSVERLSLTHIHTDTRILNEAIVHKGLRTCFTFKFLPLLLSPPQTCWTT